MKIPEHLKGGPTWRRIQALIYDVRLIRNIKFWYREEKSKSSHIFVVGPPRCGTTLAKNVIWCHPKVCSVKYETSFFLRENYIDFRHPEVPNEIMEAIINESRNDIDLFDRIASVIKEKKNGRYFLEKTPGHALRLSYIVDHFPKSTFVFVVRDPRDGLCSAKETPAVWSNYSDKDKQGGYLAVWKRSVQKYFRCKDDTSVSLLKYEDFCRYPQEIIKEIMRDIGVRWRRKQLSPTSYGNTPDSEPDSHKLLGQPVTTERIGRWREELSEKEVSRTEEVLGDAMRRLSYPLG